MKPRKGSLSRNIKDSGGMEEESCNGTATNQKLDPQVEDRTHR